MIWCPPPRHSWQKLARPLISLQRVERERKGGNVEKPRKWKFLDSLFKSHPSPKALRTCLDLPCRRSCKPPASQWPSPSQCCWPWWSSAPAPRAPWAVSCLPATAIWKASHVGVRWRECPLCPVWGTGLTSDSSDPGAQDQAWEDRSHSCCARVAPADLPALQPTGSSAGRNESLLDRFLVGLDQQLEDLDVCLREGRTLEQSPLGSENSRLAVKGYFQRISVCLKEKEYSHCAWEFVSVEIRRCLVFANKLIRKLRK